MKQVSETLRQQCDSIWAELHKHPFISEMAAGTLPARKFGFYIQQNMMFLPELARLAALGVAKAEDEQTMRDFGSMVINILDTELPKNRELFDKVKTLDSNIPEQTLMAPANLAYTRHLLTVGYSGRPVDIMTALMPCAWSYGEIGRDFVSELPDHPVYRDWIEFFAGREYWEVLEGVKVRLNRLAEGLSERDLLRLSEIFTTSSRLEHAFWDMAYDEEQWPDCKETS